MTPSHGIERVRATLERITRWMNANGASALVNNLAPGATPTQLDDAEAELGFALPPDLRALWLLHDGQLEQEVHGWIVDDDFLSVQGAIATQSTMQRYLSLQTDAHWLEAGATPRELQTPSWLPFAASGPNTVAVHAVTDRVFAFDKLEPPRLVAATFLQWLEQYAAGLEANDYVIEADEEQETVALRRRDRERERRREEEAQRAAEQLRLRREVPLLDQLRRALDQGDAERAGEVLFDACTRNEMDTLGAGVEMLFSDVLETSFLAHALRRVLRSVTLSPDQWVDVAEGGARIGNQAIRSLATSRARGCSKERLERLSRASASAPEEAREALRTVLGELAAP